MNSTPSLPKPLLIYLSISTSIILNTSSLRTSFPRLVLGLLLNFCSRFLNLAALLWVTGPDTAFLWTFVEFLFLLTSVSVIRMTTDLGPARSWIVMLVTHGARHVSSSRHTDLGRMGPNPSTYRENLTLLLIGLFSQQIINYCESF